MIDVQNYLSQYYRGTKNPSLNGMKFFMEKYNDFQKEMKFIHIAGTNGKGSCVEIISNILEKQGYKVGKFLSPHLIRYNERISINKKEITDEELAELIEELDPLVQEYNKSNEIRITLFELETIMALLYFYRNNVDFVVLETGLGGLYDCTNIITKPIVSVISSIGFDHMHLLGNTLEEIAVQKAGIIKDNSNTVAMEQSEEVNNVLINTCKNKNNKLKLVSKDEIKNYRFDENYQYFDYKDLKNVSINLKGKKQTNNSVICIEVMNILNENEFIVTEESIRKGLNTVIHKGRMEKLNEKPLIIYDGAHNGPAMENLLEMMNYYYPGVKKLYIISILKTKDYKNMIKTLMKDEDADFIFTSGNDEEKYRSAEELYEEAKLYQEDQIIETSDLEEAVNTALQGRYDLTVVAGSFYVYGDVVNIINSH